MKLKLHIRYVLSVCAVLPACAFPQSQPLSAKVLHTDRDPKADAPYKELHQQNDKVSRLKQDQINAMAEDNLKRWEKAPSARTLYQASVWCRFASWNKYEGRFGRKMLLKLYRAFEKTPAPKSLYYCREAFIQGVFLRIPQNPGYYKHVMIPGGTDWTMMSVAAQNMARSKYDKAQYTAGIQMIVKLADAKKASSWDYAAEVQLLLSRGYHERSIADLEASLDALDKTQAQTPHVSHDWYIKTKQNITAYIAKIKTRIKQSKSKTSD